jgi:hypothetical protein
MSDSDIEVVHVELSALSDREVAQTRNEFKEVKPEVQKQEENRTQRVQVEVKQNSKKSRGSKSKTSKQSGDVSESGMSILSEKKLTHLQKAREARKQKDIEIREKAKKYDELNAHNDTLNTLTENITRKQDFYEPN